MLDQSIGSLMTIGTAWGGFPLAINTFKSLFTFYRMRKTLFTRFSNCGYHTAWDVKCNPPMCQCNPQEPISNTTKLLWILPFASSPPMPRCLGELFGFGITRRRWKVRRWKLVDLSLGLHLPRRLRLHVLKVLLLLLQQPWAKKDDGDRAKWGSDQNR